MGVLFLRCHWQRGSRPGQFPAPAQAAQGHVTDTSVSVLTRAAYPDAMQGGEEGISLGQLGAITGAAGG